MAAEKDPAHFRGIPIWAKLVIILLAIVLSAVAIGFGLINARQANSSLAFSENDAKIVETVTSLGTTDSNADQNLVVHTLNVIAHLKAITNNQSLATLAVAGGSALLAIGFSLFLIGSDGAFNLEYNGQSPASGKLALFATAPGLLCIFLGALLIGVGSMRKHEFQIGDFPVQAVSKAPKFPTVDGLEKRPSGERTSSWEIRSLFCVDTDFLEPAPASKSTSQVSAITVVTGGRSRASAILAKSDTWVNGTQLTVRFMDGDVSMQEKVQRHGEEIFSFAKGLRLQFTQDESAMIRISFKDSFSWSFIGREALNIRERPTMNLGIKTSTSDAEIRAIVYHEFGHLLGLKHVHREPEASIKWNRDRITKFFAGAVNSDSSEAAAEAFISRYSQKIPTNNNQLDGDSIMRFAVPSEFTSDGVGSIFNARLSNADKDLLAEMYPAPRIQK